MSIPSSNANKLVVITGASSGIGKKIAIDLSKQGYPLLLLARRVEKCEALNLPNTLSLKVDVTNQDEMKNAIETAEKKFGPVFSLINNAGVMLLDSMAHQDPKEWSKMFNVNVFGVLNGIKCVLDKMIERGDGVVVNISSIAGQKLFPSHTVYCATKFAVHALTEGIRQECAPHSVRVSVISPGAVETELLGHTTVASEIDGYKQWKKTMKEGVLLPEDVSNAVSFVINAPKRCCVREITLAPTNQVP